VHQGVQWTVLIEAATDASDRFGRGQVTGHLRHYLDAIVAKLACERGELLRTTRIQKQPIAPAEYTRARCAHAAARAGNQCQGPRHASVPPATKAKPPDMATARP
jgi:hypothetical protein